MMSDEWLYALMGATFLSAPLLCHALRSRRAHRVRRDAATDQGFMTWLESVRKAAEEQESDPRVAAIVARFEHSITGTAPRTGRHRAVPTSGGRHRLATASA